MFRTFDAADGFQREKKPLEIRKFPIDFPDRKDGEGEEGDVSGCSSIE